MSPADPRRSGNPAKRASAPASEPSNRSSNRFQDVSRNVLVRLSALPPLAIPAGMLILTLIGLSAPLPYAVPALVIAALFVGWLVALSWPVLSPSGRFVRGLMLGLIVGAMAARITGVL